MSTLVTDNLPLIATAPDGIKRLRGLILELAVRGKLVPQDPADEPASELLRRIEVEKARLVKEGKIRKPKATELSEEWVKPLSTPNGWQWALLGTVTLEVSSGGTPSKNNSAYWGGDIPWASVKDLGFGEPVTITQDRITIDGLKAGSFLAQAGSVLVCTRMGLGKIGQAKIDVAINQDLKALRLPVEIDAQYFINFFKTLSIKGSGMTVAGIRQDELLRFPIPLPPLPEQHRIVARVDELMALCDRLEAEQADAAEAHARLIDALLATLTASRDAAECAANWQRLHEHFDTLFTTEASITALKQTVLQLAVMGRLVPQDPTDEPASELLKRIEAEKARLVKEGKIRKPKAVEPVGEDERPFEVPEGWEWCRFDSIALSRLGKMLDAAKNRGLPRPYLRNTNVQWFIFDLSDIKQMRLADDELEEYRVELGDLLICEGGEPGRCAIWRGETEEMYFQKALHRVRPLCDVLPEYLAMLLRQDAMSGALAEYFTGATIKHFPGDKLQKYRVPLPPLPEQHRIVARVNELMALCDRLQADLATARDHRARLADTLVQAALEAA